MSKRAALVLAGGKASRFQSLNRCWQNKALALFGDKPFLVHVVENVIDAVHGRVIVCVNDEERRESYLKVLEKYHLNVEITVDENTEVGGPMRAVFTGLKAAAQADHCLIVPCDMPFVRADVVNYMFRVSEKFKVVMPMWPDGMLETLFMVLERSTGFEIVETLCQLGRSRVDDIPRAANKTLLVSPIKGIKTFDPQLESFRNINYSQDVEKLQTRNTQGQVREDIMLLREKILTSDLHLMQEAIKMSKENNFAAAQEKLETCKNHFNTVNNFFWTALSCEAKGDTLLKQFKTQKNPDQTNKVKEAFLYAAENYDREAKVYEKRCCTRLLERAITDKNRCKNSTNFSVFNDTKLIS